VLVASFTRAQAPRPWVAIPRTVLAGRIAVTGVAWEPVSPMPNWPDVLSPAHETTLLDDQHATSLLVMTTSRVPVGKTCCGEPSSVAVDESRPAASRPVW